MVPGLLTCLLATKRVPWASKARALGSSSPVRMAVGVVLPGELAHRGAIAVGYEEVAASIEGHGPGPIQPGQGGGGAG